MISFNFCCIPGAEEAAVADSRVVGEDLLEEEDLAEGELTCSCMFVLFFIIFSSHCVVFD